MIRVKRKMSFPVRRMVFEVRVMILEQTKTTQTLNLDKHLFETEEEQHFP